MPISAIKIKWQKTPQRAFFYLKKNWVCHMIWNTNLRAFGSHPPPHVVWLSLEGKCSIHFQDSVKDALCERQDSAPWPTTYMCSNLLYKNAENNSDNFWVLIEVAGQKYFSPCYISIFWLRLADLFELGYMNHHIQYVSLICMLKYFSLWNGTIIHIISSTFWIK